MKLRKRKANTFTFRQARNALFEMVRHNIKLQYRNSILGVAWTILNPLLTMIVLALVFSRLLSNRGITIDYPVYIMCGNVVFSFMRMCTSQCLPCIVSNGDLLTKTRVPHIVFPLSTALSSSINFAFSIIAVLLVMLVRMWSGADITFSWTIIMIVPYFPALFGFSLGVGLILCVIFVRFRDIKHLYGIFLMLWTYGTPLFYSETILSDKMATVELFNPMYHFVKYFREVVALGDAGDFKTLGICYASAAAAMIVGLLLFNWRKKVFALYV
ncbi:MAG: ABC transporter permease [Clostridia bacterium]|nr:ABC transporter permease [Clostridia bacterium]